MMKFDEIRHSKWSKMVVFYRKNGTKRRVYMRRKYGDIRDEGCQAERRILALADRPNYIGSEPAMATLLVPQDDQLVKVF